MMAMGCGESFSMGDIDVLAAEREAHRLRAEAVAAFFSGLGRWLTKRLFGLGATEDGVDALYGMSDRELADIGLTRDDVDSVAAGTYQDGHGRMAAPRPAPEHRRAA